MLSNLNAPRELVFLMRLVALIGATKIGIVVYTHFLDPTPPSAAEIAASEREIAALAEDGGARVFADFRRRAPGVLDAARKCETTGGAPCRWAEIWVERYRAKADDVERAPDRYGPEVVAAAREYQAAADLMRKREGDGGRSPPGAKQQP